MRCHSLFALALSLPISLADVLSSTYTVQSLTCFTGFTSTSASGSLPTTMYLNTIEELPQILHITLIPTVTITPKPFITKWTELETVTVYANATPWSGTWTTTSTQFDVSTSWHHRMTTSTKTEFITGTTRKTSWIPAPSDFIPVRNSTSGLGNETRDGLQARAEKSKVKVKVQAPLAAKYPAAVNCTNVIKIYTTETMIFTARKTRTITLDRETLFNTTTQTATFTSTILHIPTGTEITAITTASTNSRRGWWNFMGSYTTSISNPFPTATSTATATADTTLTADPSAAATNTSSIVPTSTPGPDGIVTLTATTTLTPFTITVTWTGTMSQTLTSTFHATTTTSSYLACASSNQLGATSKNQRINALLSNIHGNQTLRAIGGVGSAYECCVECITGDANCAWSLWQIGGRDRGMCLLYETDSCEGGQAADLGGYAFREGAGERAFAVSNGVCGGLGEVDLVVPL